MFNSRFAQVLQPFEQRLHLFAIGLVGLAIALIMTPAAFHRQTGPKKVTLQFIRLSTRLVLWSMPPLASSLCVEFYLISRIITDRMIAAVLAATLFAVFVVLWFVLPRRGH